jgi:hypothetical protein
MAKSGPVSLDVASDPQVENAVLKNEAPILTLGAIAALALGASSFKLVERVNLADRTVGIFNNDGFGYHAASASTDTAKADNAANLLAKFTQDVDGKITPWTGVATGADAMAGLLAVANTATKPTRSLAALISAVEDYLAANPPGFGVDVIVDQIAAEVRVVKSLADPLPTAGAPDEQFSQSVTDTSGAIKNEFE